MGQNRVTPKWVALVSGNVDQNLRSPGGLILTHTQRLDGFACQAGLASLATHGWQASDGRSMGAELHATRHKRTLVGSRMSTSMKPERKLQQTYYVCQLALLGSPRRSDQEMHSFMLSGLLGCWAVRLLGCWVVGCVGLLGWLLMGCWAASCWAVDGSVGLLLLLGWLLGLAVLRLGSSCDTAHIEANRHGIKESNAWLERTISEMASNRVLRFEHCN